MGDIFNIEEIRNMSVNDIIKDYDKLSERCEEVDLTKKGSEVTNIVARMKRVIEDGNLKGLSANQIGYSKRIICINFNGKIRTFINPIIEKAEGIELSEERCSSIPRKRFIRIRNSKITVIYQTPLGKVESAVFQGLAAKVLQHHIDHLDGILLSDIGLPIDYKWDKASDEERQEVINMYLDALDMTADELKTEAAEDPDTKQIMDAIAFTESVKRGDTKIEQMPLTQEEMDALKQGDEENG